MKTYITTAVTILAVLLLASGGLLVTHAATPPKANDHGQNNSSQDITMNIMGEVANAGNQRYFIQQNGPAMVAMIDGVPLVTSHLSYTLNVYQQGLSTSGSATFELTGTFANGTTYNMSGNIQMVSSIAGACLPFPTTGPPTTTYTGPCTSPYTSEVPAAFVGAGTVQANTGTSSNGNGCGNGDNSNGNRNGNGNNHGQSYSSNWNGDGDGSGCGNNSNGNGYGQGNGHSYSSADNSQTTMTETMAFENAYFNPFGAAITIASLDNSIMILTTYTQATIDWTNVVDAGGFMGSLGATPIMGSFAQMATEHEDLVSGKAWDSGMLTLSDVVNLTDGSSISYLNAQGAYLGTSAIPTTGAIPCGTGCTETGFQDQGHFMLFSGDGHGALIIGSYNTTWTVPAFGFSSTVTAHVIQRSS